MTLQKMKLQIAVFVALYLTREINAQFSYHEVAGNISAEIRTELSSECRQQWERYSVFTSTFWMMADSSSKIPSGIAKGNIMPLGNYDECFEIEEVPTKFCQASININWPSQNFNPELFGVAPETSGNVGFQMYYCVFESCNAQDLNTIFSGFALFEDPQCWSKNSGSLDGLAIATIVIFVLIGLLTLSSTIYDIRVYYRGTTPFHPLATAFSLLTNGRKLFHVGNPQKLQCLNGIKSISMLWVVLGHVYMAYVFVPLDNYLEVYHWIESTYSQYITGATVSVDTFLVVGGVLTMHTFQSAMDKGTNFNVPLYYLHRYLRLTPALAASVLAHAGVFNHMGSGPVWNRTDTYLSKACRENWWSALLYVQNYANPNGNCVPQSWYLSVDMQLFIVSPPILVLMRRWPRWGYITLGASSGLSMLASFLLGWFYKLGGQMTANLNGNLSDYMAYYYMPTHTRMVPYLFGIMLGYYIYHTKTNKIHLQIGTSFASFSWIVSLLLMAACLFAGHNLQTFNYDRLANSFFLALMRPAWAIAICWIVFACTMGYGGPVDTFLSLPVFQILSRISYSIYLVHYSFIFMTNFATRSPLHFSDYNAFHKFCGDFVFSLVIAVFWCLIFESPVVVLEKSFLGRRKTREETKSEEKV